MVISASHTVISHIIHVHLFLEAYPVMAPHATNDVPIFSKMEEGVRAALRVGSTNRTCAGEIIGILNDFMRGKLTPRGWESCLPFIKFMTNKQPKIY